MDEAVPEPVGESPFVGPGERAVCHERRCSIEQDGLPDGPDSSAEDVASDACVELGIRAS